MEIVSNVRKIGENDICEFYQNSWTDGAENYAKQYGIKTIHCALAVQKSDPEDKDYVLIENGQVIFHSKSFESIGAHIDMEALGRGFTKE